MRTRLIGLALAAVCLGLEAHAVQDPPPAEDPSEILNTLLGGLLGFTDLTGPELQKEVAASGGVPFKADVPLDFMSRGDLGRYLRELFDAEYPVDKARADARLLTALGLLEPGTDLRSLRARVMEENIAGFYDERPGHRRLYAVSADRRLSPANQLILAHELRHALQDQYVDLQGVIPDDVSDFDDRRLAWVSLLEGDATLVMERYLARRIPGAEEATKLMGASLPTPEVPGAPPVVRDQLVRPYFMGLDFVSALVDKGGWDAVQAAWKKPPESTEQVLHVEKFLVRESPRALPPVGTPQGGRQVMDGVLGEMLVETLLGGDRGSARGWGGDRYTVWDISGRTVLLWRSTWDTEEDRRRFAAALAGRLGVKAIGSTAPSFRAVTDRAGWVRAVGETKGQVVLVASDEARLAQEAMARAERLAVP